MAQRCARKFDRIVVGHSVVGEILGRSGRTAELEQFPSTAPLARADRHGEPLGRVGAVSRRSRTQPAPVESPATCVAAAALGRVVSVPPPAISVNSDTGTAERMNAAHREMINRLPVPSTSDSDLVFSKILGHTGFLDPRRSGAAVDAGNSSARMMRPPGWSSCRGRCIRTFACSRFSVGVVRVRKRSPVERRSPFCRTRRAPLEDQARSVYSPAAYLADLLQLRGRPVRARRAHSRPASGSRTSRSTPRTPSPRSRTSTS